MRLFWLLGVQALSMPAGITDDSWKRGLGTGECGVSTALPSQRWARAVFSCPPPPFFVSFWVASGWVLMQRTEDDSSARSAWSRSDWKNLDHESGNSGGHALWAMTWERMMSGGMDGYREWRGWTELRLSLYVFPMEAVFIRQKRQKRNSLDEGFIVEFCLVEGGGCGVLSVGEHASRARVRGC